MQSTVGQLKEQLVSVSGIPADRQRLIFRGSVLQDAQLLTSQRDSLWMCFQSTITVRLSAERGVQFGNDAGIESGHTIHMVERPEGLPPPGSIPETQPDTQPLREQRIDVGLIHINGATTIAATGVRLPSIGLHAEVTVQELAT